MGEVMRRSVAVGALAAAIVGAGASPAWAGGAGSGGAGFVPIETVVPGYYDPLETQACGDTVTVDSGDVRETQIRPVTRPDGTVVNDYRGAATVDLTRQSDGAMIDELDISGRAHEVISPDGGRIDVTLEAPSILFPGPGEEALFEAAGLFDLTYVKRGEVTLHITFDPDTGAELGLSADIDARLVDLCRKFDRHGHGHGHGHAGAGDHHGVVGGHGGCPGHRG
jgi:hypothetical protein